MKRQVKSIILAAGKGSRMESDLPKVLHSIAGKPMISHILETFNSIDEIDESILVLGHEKDKVLAKVGKDVSYVIQGQQLGTGHAVKAVKEKFKNFNGDVFIAYGDCPLLTKKTIKAFIQDHQNHNVVCSILTAHLDNPSGYGRIVKKENYVAKIVEELDATPEVREIKEVNSGVYIVNSKMLFKALENVKNHNVKKEYYLTDIIGYFVSQGLKVNSYKTANIVEIQGINTKHQLQYVESILKSR